MIDAVIVAGAILLSPVILAWFLLHKVDSSRLSNVVFTLLDAAAKRAQVTASVYSGPLDDVEHVMVPDEVQKLFTAESEPWAAEDLRRRALELYKDYQNADETLTDGQIWSHVVHRMEQESGGALIRDR